MSDGFGDAMGMVGTGIGLGIMGMGAASLIKSLNSVGTATKGNKRRKASKRKTKSRKK
jgi:hypothetical protein